jgi:hypothetical protein
MRHDDRIQARRLQKRVVNVLWQVMMLKSGETFSDALSTKLA